MSTSVSKYICIHGHFYQPPRENAWLEVIEVQDSAHPYHDWNERITAECYGPNAASRILDENHVIKKIVNNYAKISFNFGPTLLSWLERHDSGTYQAILEADQLSVKNFSGHGSAIAQVYNHIIMPLANFRDKETQVIWGISDFVHRFNRKPEGMWLAETAVDLETLEILAKHHIKFTILAPRQARRVRALQKQEWQEVNDHTIDTRRPYLCTLPSGKSIVIFFYDGDRSQGVAFNGLLNDGKRFADSLINGFDSNNGSPQLVSIATDGESYGHHHKHGDMALAFCLDYIEKVEDVKLTNYAEYAALHPPEWEVEIIEDSSWSCVHGVERWRNDCGCNSGGNPSWHQRWRKPLREALDWLRDTIVKLFEAEGQKYLNDCWQARNSYIHVILDRSDAAVERFLKEQLKEEANATHVLRLMEMQRHALLMYTSCGWFFDEVSGIETTQVMQYACRAIQLTRQLMAVDVEQEFLLMLGEIPSNVPALENGMQVYRKYVTPSKINLQRVGMHYAVSSIFEEEPETLPLFNYVAINDFFLKKEAGEQKLVLGITKVKSLVTRSEKKFAFAVVCIGVHNIIGNISLDMEPDRFASMQYRITAAFDEGRIGDVIGVMQTYFGPDKYTIWQLFTDEKRKILDMIAQNEMFELEESLRRTYNRDYPLVNALANNEIPIPNAYRTTFEYILNADLLRALAAERLNVKTIERVTAELKKWNLKIEDRDKLSRLAGECILRELRKVNAEGDGYRRIQKLNRLFPLLHTFKLSPNLHHAQNLYFEMSLAMKSDDQVRPQEWREQLLTLGTNLGVKIE